MQGLQCDFQAGVQLGDLKDASRGDATRSLSGSFKGSFKGSFNRDLQVAGLIFFFSSGLADHALRLGPYMRRSCW